MRNSAWKRRDKVNMIRNASHADKIGTEIAADCSKICMYPRPHIRVEPRFAILGAEDDVKDNFAERLRH